VAIEKTPGAQRQNHTADGIHSEHEARRVLHGSIVCDRRIGSGPYHVASIARAFPKNKKARPAQCQASGILIADTRAMDLTGGRLVWSASDVVDFLACEHVTSLERAVAAQSLARPAASDELKIVLERGREHEKAILTMLADGVGELVSIERRPGTAGYAAGASETRAAMAAGVPLITGATFLDDDFVGFADLLVRVESPSCFGTWSYEVADIKLAKHAKPSAIIQLCAYSTRLALVQERVPERMHLILDTPAEPQSFRFADYSAYYREVERRFVESIGKPPVSYPDRITACGTCRWNERCAEVRRNDDNLSLVANIRRDQIGKLVAAGMTTVEDLASSAPSDRPPGLAVATWEALRGQARLQFAMRADNVHRREFLPLVTSRGFGRLPAPSVNDIYFDMEGDPFYEGGSFEYLFGYSYRHADGTPAFEAIWADDRASEIGAFERFIQTVISRRTLDPSMHVYHYANYEQNAMIKLSRFGPYETIVDQMLSDGVFVDLYTVVRQALRLSTESYSIKKVEKYYRPARSSDVQDAMGSVIFYERYLRTGDRSLLVKIEEYNKDDCDSTLELHDWLLTLKAEAELELGAYAMPETVTSRERSEQSLADEAETTEISLQLDAGPQHTGAALLRDLLDYHRREAGAEWREYFARCAMLPAELVNDSGAIGELRVAADVAPQPIDRSMIYAFDFPLQKHKMRVGTTVDDPVTMSSAGEVTGVEVRDAHTGRVYLKRGPSLAKTDFPQSLVPNSVIGSGDLKASLRRVGRKLARGQAVTPLVADILERRPVRLRTLTVGIESSEPNALTDLVCDLNDSYLVVQGPPGSGKTWTGARVIVALLQRGLRVGVCSGTHKAIHNLLHEVEAVAAEARVSFRGWKKSEKKDREKCFDSRTGAIENIYTANLFAGADDVSLMAGTQWLFAREDLEQKIDVLVVDEAGQLALADAVAIAPATRCALFLGDPQQLPQVTTGAHPDGAAASILEHLLGDAITVSADRGVFLGISYRMHPGVCAFVSELMYEGRLHSAQSCANQAVVGSGGELDGAGLRAMPVVHSGCSSESLAEAERIADAIAQLRGATIVGSDRSQRACEPERDVLVVAPYNAQVALLRRVFAQRGLGNINVGTVDKFQGQEAPIVFFSMTTSSGEDVPRDLEFLFDRNRLNVAISRARALAVLVSSPTLLAIRCTTVDQMQLVNALARFHELAAAAPQRVGAPA
jgi:predicted RecB family nuclease